MRRQVQTADGRGRRQEGEAGAGDRRQGNLSSSSGSGESADARRSQLLPSAPVVCSCRLHLLLFLPGSERLATGVLLLDRAGLIHEEGEAAGVVVARGFGVRLVALAAGAGRDRELIAGRLGAEYVFGDEAGVNQRVQVARRARVLERVGDLGGLDALEHVFGVRLVRGDALLEEEFLPLLLDERGGVAVADDPRAALADEVDRLALHGPALARLHEDRGLLAAHLFARQLEVGRGYCGPTPQIGAPPF